MAYDARIFRVLIASPSDVDEERELVVSIIQAWNDLYSFARKVVLLPLRWETHTAPEYGTRPQEVINRAIVDECDLLVGIFWTRLGSPTGIADSGTLEEIERVGKAGKPIMLYFSRVAIDPEKIDMHQIEQLKKFKNNSYPKGLIENYRLISEFRDKFNRQLEMKIRELQQSEPKGAVPLRLTLLSERDAQPVGPKYEVALSSESVQNLQDVLEDKRERIQQLLDEKTAAELTQPVVIGIENTGSTGIRNWYVQLEFSTSSAELSLSNRHPGRSARVFYKNVFSSMRIRGSEALEALEKTFTQFEPGVLTSTEGVWKLGLEWDAIQPQRLRLVKPFLFLRAKSSGSLKIIAKIYSDSFAAPYLLEAELSVKSEISNAALDDALPEWKEILSDEENNKEKQNIITFN